MALDALLEEDELGGGDALLELLLEVVGDADDELLEDGSAELEDELLEAGGDAEEEDDEDDEDDEDEGILKRLGNLYLLVKNNPVRCFGSGLSGEMSWGRRARGG